MRNLAWTSVIRVVCLKWSPNLIGEGVLSTFCSEDPLGLSEECGWCPRQDRHSFWQHSALVSLQEIECRALNPSLGMPLWGDPDICCSPDSLCWHCQPSLANAEGFLLNLNLAVCLELYVLSCQYERIKKRYMGNGRRKNFEATRRFC